MTRLSSWLLLLILIIQAVFRGGMLPFAAPVVRLYFFTLARKFDKSFLHDIRRCSE
jgi:hypothetical protein